MKKLRQPIHALVFDLDDTLYPELEYVHSGFGAVARALAVGGKDPGELEKILWRAYEQGPRDKVFNAVLRDLNQPENPVKVLELVQVYRNHLPQLHLEASTWVLLKNLRPRFKLGLLTDGYLPAQRLKIEALGLARLFDHIICTEELGRQYWKPSPIGFENMARVLGCEHAACAYIADNPAKDFLAPNLLGWQSIQVKRHDRVRGEIAIPPGGAPQTIISNLTEIVGLL